MVFYRKYRPQTIEELDTSAIRQNLGAVLSSGHLPHALLFTGSRGLGKTSAARIVAKSVNCLKGENGIPCGACSSCISIAEGRNLDVLEIDAASNRGIDEIRDLREKIKLSPTGSRFKVYIIDEVHMLTTEAFNALLKTLEEPPGHAIFILCTTESHKLPPTIISRCLRFDFKRASKDDLIRSLERIVKGEKLKVEKEALTVIAQAGDGSFRDAVKILEQAALSGREITKEQIKELLGETQNLKPEVLLKLLSAKDARGAILEINRLVEAGENLRVYTEKILNLLHQILMVKVGVEDESVDGELVSLWGKEDLLKLIELFSRACNEFKTAIIPQLPLELAIVEYCEEAGGALKSDAGGLGKVSNASVPVVTAGDLGARSVDSTDSRENLPRGTPPSPPKSAAVESISTPLPNSKDIAQLWPQMIEATKEHNHTVAGVLRGCRPQNFDGKILTVETFYQFHKDKLNEPKIREFLDKTASSVFGEKIVFKCVLGEKEKVIK